MDISKEIVELAEKVRKYRTDTNFIEELKIKNESLENQIKELEKTVKILKLNTIEQNKLLEQIKELEDDKKKLKLALEISRKEYNFVVTAPNEASNTVYGEISRELSEAQNEILICSPWITYIVDELSSFYGKKSKRKTNIRIITRLIKEDVDKGATDLDKLRTLQGLGAEIRYNNNLHAKLVVIDDSVAIISSANLTKKGFEVNYEAGVCVRNKEMVNKVSQFFNVVWKESSLLTEEAINHVLMDKGL